MLICQEEKSWLSKEELGIEPFVKKEKVYQKNIKASFSKRESGLSKREEIVCKENYERKIVVIGM